MKKIAVFPGSFDPLTKGHEDIIYRGLRLFDEVIVALGTNSEKNYLFSPEQRKSFLVTAFSAEKKIRVMEYAGLTVNFCREVGADYILRGLRNPVDFEFEKNIAQMNRALEKNIETIFLVSRPELASVSSSILREIFKNGGDISSFLPRGIDLHR